MFVFVVSIVSDPTHQLKNLSPVIHFYDTKCSQREYRSYQSTLVYKTKVRALNVIIHTIFEIACNCPLVTDYGIPEDHIFNSRDHSFATGVKRMTGGRGVDVVLNSLAGEALRQTWLCVAPFGRFNELGKKDIGKYMHKFFIKQFGY